MTLSTAWLTWTCTSLLLLISTRNPAYILVTLIFLFLLGTKISQNKEFPNWTGQNLRFMVSMVGISIMINTLFAHTGQSILFSFPNNWPLIGGNITFESLLYGAINGLIIGSLYLVFNIFNLVLSTKQITRMIPNAFRPISIMITISLTFFPSIQHRTREIREAQIIRGNKMKKVSDWIPIIIPLLVTSLENAFLLSESLSSRGFYSKPSNKNSQGNLIVLVLSIFLIFAGWILHLYDYPIVASIIFYCLGFGGFLFIFIYAGRQVNVTHFHEEIWRVHDIIFVGVNLIFTCALIVLTLTKNLSSLEYSPFPRLSFPDISVLGILASALPGLPLFFIKHD